MTDQETILFENEVYEVILNDDLDGYVVVNKDTQIYEVSTDYLPDAILAAIDGQARLKWYEDLATAMAAQAEAADAGDPLEIEVELDDRTIN